MAIEFNDNLHVKVNRPTDFRFGPFVDIAQANSIIPIAQRHHGLIFGIYTNPGDIANSDILYYYYWKGLTDVDYLPLFSDKPPVDGSYVDETAMITAQPIQLANYIYYDGTSYWEYLGTTNGNITDYREIGGGGGGGGCEIVEESFFYTVGSPSFNLALAPPKVWVFINGVYIPEANYTLSGLNVTIDATVPANSRVIIKYCVATTTSIIFPPVAGSYISSVAMIAAQGTQVAQYVYYDGTYYWEYLGSTNGNITDYRIFGDISALYFEKTYSEVVALSVASLLVPGATYLVTDFQTIHRILGTIDINTGPIEPLFVKAVSSVKLDSLVISQTYPNDAIQIDWSNVLCEDGLTPRKGWIVDRIDPINDIHVQGYDWRNVKFRRYKILSKRKDEITSVSSTSLQVFVSTGGTLGASLNIFFLLNAYTGAITHDAGPITITIQNGTYTYTRPLYKYDNSTTFTANELANRNGQIVYCPTRDAFVYMYMDASGFGENIVTYTLAPYSSAIWSPGYGISYNIDPLDFADLTTLGSVGTSTSVHIGIYRDASTSNMGNNVFYSGAVKTTIGSNCHSNTSVFGLNSFTAGTDFYNNYMIPTLAWCQIENEVFNCFFNSASGNSQVQDITITNTTYNCSFYLYSYYSIDLSAANNSSFYLFGNIFTFTGGFYESSKVYLIGDGGGEGRTNFICRSPFKNSLIGYFYATDFTINQRLNGVSYYERPISNNIFDSIALRDIPVGTPVATLGVTAEGDVVVASGLTLEDIVTNGNVSTSVIKHADGVAPNDSATVGQLDDLRIELNSTLNLRSLGISISGGGNPITTGIKGYLTVPYNCEIVAWYLVADTVGSIEIDVWSAISVPNSGDTITGADRPKLVTAQANENETLTLWTTTLTKGDIMAFNVISASTVTFANLVIKTNLTT